MRPIRTTLLAMIPAILLAACATPPDTALYEQSPDIAPYMQDSFADYVSETRDWIAAHRVFLTDDHEMEIARNAPFEMRPDADGTCQPRRGVLFVHGLGSSPWYFNDIATEMAKDGWLARSML